MLFNDGVDGLIDELMVTWLSGSPRCPHVCDSEVMMRRWWSDGRV